MQIKGNDEWKEIYNYITNLQEELEEEKRIEQKSLETINDLQEENERLKIDNKTLKRWYQLNKSRNEKAIEFVKKESRKCYTNQISENPLKVIGNFMWHTDELLNILQGENDDRRNME